MELFIWVREEHGHHNCIASNRRDCARSSHLMGVANRRMSILKSDPKSPKVLQHTPSSTTQFADDQLIAFLVALMTNVNLPLNCNHDVTKMMCNFFCFITVFTIFSNSKFI